MTATSRRAKAALHLPIGPRQALEMLLESVEDPEFARALVDSALYWAYHDEFIGNARRASAAARKLHDQLSSLTLVSPEELETINGRAAMAHSVKAYGLLRRAHVVQACIAGLSQALARTISALSTWDSSFPPELLDGRAVNAVSLGAVGATMCALSRGRTLSAKCFGLTLVAARLEGSIRTDLDWGNRQERWKKRKRNAELLCRRLTALREPKSRE